MTRRRRYKQCLFWRGFLTKSKSISDCDELKRFIFSLNQVTKVEIQHGWTTWVTVCLKDGSQFVEKESWPIDSLKAIAVRIYKHAVGEYLDYINQ